MPYVIRRPGLPQHKSSSPLGAFDSKPTTDTWLAANGEWVDTAGKAREFPTEREAMKVRQRVVDRTVVELV